MPVDLQIIKYRIKNATRDPYNNRKVINVEIKLLMEMITELEHLRSIINEAPSYRQP